MNLRILFLWGMALFSITCSSAQDFKFDSLVAQHNAYIHSITESPNQRYICYSVGSQMTVLLDSQLNEIKRFTYDHLYGGGEPVFSDDSKYLAFKVYNEVDTVVIYQLELQNEERISTSVSKLLFLRNSHQLLISYNGNFSLYDIDQQKWTNTRFSVGSLKDEFMASYCLDSSGKYLYVSTTAKTIEAYNTQTWKPENILGPFSESPDNLVIREGYLCFTVRNMLYSIDLKTEKQIEMNTGAMSYVSGIALTNKPYTVVLYGNVAKVYAIDLRSLSNKPLVSDLNKGASYGVFQLADGRLLVGDFNELKLYQASR